MASGFQRIAQHTFMLRVDERVCGTVYLIEEDGKRLVVDSGDGRLKLGFVPDVCILTHGHFDHTQGVRKDWPSVLLHPAEFGFEGLYVHIPANARPLHLKTLGFGSHQLEFLHTPGHTPGSICILDRKTGCLFSGDTKFADGEVGRTDLGGNEDELKKSLGMIEKMEYRLLCPGHGELELKE
ncbi:MAG: MBL fold metallo-hydrolase [Candidatus Micrarchaeota archaeon]|nr:MBL fold metallo-hydrolase [Candidatus Micrarchaeota archaeon]